METYFLKEFLRIPFIKLKNNLTLKLLIILVNIRQLIHLTYKLEARLDEIIIEEVGSDFKIDIEVNKLNKLKNYKIIFNCKSKYIAKFP